MGNDIEGKGKDGNMSWLHKLKLHELYEDPEGFYSVMRVPHGWIYHFPRIRRRGFDCKYALTSVFVPYSNEFAATHFNNDVHDG